MTGKRSFVMAVAQMGAVNLDDSRASVVARLVEMLKEAKGRGAQFVVFPELALTTFFPRYWMEEAEAQARFFEQTLPSAQTLPLFDAARDLGLGFYLGYAELTPEGTPYNSAVIVRPDGSIAGKYRKIHLPGHSDHKPAAPFQHLEKKYFEVGDLGFGVHDVPLGGAQVRMGMCLCNDRRWPETYRVMALQSAEVVVLGYNTPSLNIHWNEPVHLRTTTHLISLQANAYQNGLWVAAAAKCGSEDGHHMIGSSVIVAPTGEIVARAVSEDDEVIAANVDLSLGEMFREHVFNFAKHRRPEHYKLITERTGAGAPVK
ncbi:N-carbamoyl-D-amino acid hydrolase [Lampropedia cohaerens]|uniref:N-carbamoyl-D-amino acid hydrolase n=1 Tax=Lampropedia cohaerens TaxID=1610491 RepID=A0A0U1Q1Z9_9BURK|nr:N-carbamoyl-D-amino-acid hydrolase [Lampropedia cohaerens]KKW68789.1 N-carbamoyl-D-amino acid hydrolase [Lampropedia cohaerens]